MANVRIWLAAMAFLLAMTGPAFAEGFALYEYSARGVALGGSMAARKPDASAVAYNPALLTRLPGKHAMLGVTAVIPNGKMDWIDQNGRKGTTELRDSVWSIPHAYYTQQVNDAWWLGIGEFTRYGLGFEYPHNWPGRFNIYEVSLLSGSLNPVVAWRATDKLSLAAGLEVVYVTLDLKRRTQVPLEPLIPGGSFEVDASIKDADSFGYGFNLAAHYQINDAWAVGVQYRSQVKVKAYGDIEFSYMGSSGVPGPFEGAVQQGYAGQFQDGSVHSTVILPDSISGGVSWTPLPELSLEAGLVWTRWSTFSSLNIHMPNGLPTSHSTKNWKDVWRFNFGVEYDILDWLTLRAGYTYDESPMREAYEDYLVPTGDRHLYSAGVGFHWGDWNLDLAYCYIDPATRSYTRNDTLGTVRSKTRDTSTQLFSLSIGYEF